MRTLLAGLRRDESGQDLVEYTLLLAFVVIASAALLIQNGESIATIWCSADNNLWKAVNSTGL